MAKINNLNNKFYWIYLTGVFAILFLPALFSAVWFFPPDWGKTIMFRSILAFLLFLFLWQVLYRSKQLALPNIGKNPAGKPGASNGAGKIIWALAGLFLVNLLASIFSVDSYFSFWGSPHRSGGFVNFGFYIIYAIFLFLIIRGSDWKKILDFSILIGAVIALIAIFQFYGLFGNTLTSVENRPYSTSGNPIMLATYLLMLCFPVLSFLLKENKIWKKIFYSTSLFLLLFGIMLAGSRAAYFGLAIGAIYFFLFIPSKNTAIKKAKIIFGLIFILAAIFFLSVNLNAQLAKFLSQSRTLENIVNRISFAQAVDKNRVAAWGVGIKAALDKPLLGWGPENFSIGFDKFYDPAIPYLYMKEDWFDKAHNAFIETAATAGLPALVIYLSLFIVLFWQLHKVKHAENNADSNAEKTLNNALMAHGVQVAFIAYLCAIFFSFDDSSSYLTCFLLIGYSMHLISSNMADATSDSAQAVPKPIKGRGIITVFSALLLMLFLWQYNFLPLEVNAEKNKAQSLSSQKDCVDALAGMDKILPVRTILDSYLRIEYIDMQRNCNDWYPENALAYTKRGYELAEEGVKIQPFYTRYWIALGNLLETMAGQEKNPETQKKLIKNSLYYFDRAAELAPKRWEIFAGKAKTEMLAGDYESAKKDSEKCVEIKNDMGNCHWSLGLSEIYLKNYAQADEEIKLAQEEGYDINSLISLGGLGDAYGSIPDYKNLAIVFEKIIAIKPDVAQYHSSLAFFYFNLKDYKKARQEALMTLQLSPESKPNVDAFLKSLPY